MRLETKTIINAPVQLVWQYLTQTTNYDKWNPFIKKVDGTLEVGQTINVTIQPPNQKPMQFTPTILTLKTNEEFRWLGHLWFKGIFDGEHYFKLNRLSDNQTEFIHGESFTGLLARPILWMIKKNTLAGFEAMNQALKDITEQQFIPSKTTI